MRIILLAVCLFSTLNIYSQRRGGGGPPQGGQVGQIREMPEFKASNAVGIFSPIMCFSL